MIPSAGGAPALGKPPRQAYVGRRFRLPPPAVFGFLLPNFVGFLVFTLFPIALSVYMAFTNWSLKPAIERRFLGLGNFRDLLGVRALPGEDPTVLWAGYAAAALVALAGGVGFVLAVASTWRGTKWGGCLLAGTGLATVVAGLVVGAPQGVVVAGVIALLCGLAAAWREGGDWGFGLGTVAGLMVLAGSAALWLLHRPLWTACEPRDPRFWKYFYNTLYLMMRIPFTIAGSLALALLVNNRVLAAGGDRRTVGRISGTGVCCLLGVMTAGILWALGRPNLALLGLVFWTAAALGFAFDVVSFRTLYYLPTFCAGVALIILWKNLYNPETGPINTVLAAALEAVGIGAERIDELLPGWHTEVGWAKPSLIVMATWTLIGGTNMLLYLAGLSNVPQDLLDAAAVDGAGPWARFRHVTWPQLAPTTFFISIISVIQGLQGGFEAARVMTQGGPAGATTTLSYYIYQKLYEDLELGYAAAISLVLFALIFLGTAVNWRFGKGLEVSP